MLRNLSLVLLQSSKVFGFQNCLKEYSEFFFFFETFPSWLKCFKGLSELGQFFLVEAVNRKNLILELPFIQERI
jgi:hypothetical protein